MKIFLPVLLVIISGCSSRPGRGPEGERVTATAQPAAIEPLTANSNALAGELEVVARDAIGRALPFVEREGTAWMEGRVPVQEGSGCVSCHHVGFALWSHAEARRVGIDDLAPAFEALAETAITFLNRPTIPRAMSAGHVMLAEPGHASVLTQHMLDLQNEAGDWSAVGQFPTQRRPIAESDAVATMYALLALRKVGGDGEVDPAIRAKALEWLEQQPSGTSTEWLAWRLVLANALDAADQVPGLRHRLIDRQREDGGWGWVEDAESDAFSTGQAVYALSITADERSSVIENGTRFLIARQSDDGSWQTASSVISDAPSAEKDVIYHFWGTAWATIALARAIGA